jgi:DNA-binding LacI/PurR family transcriptional regulator
VERLLGYREALEQYGVAYDPGLVVYGRVGMSEAYEHVRHAMTHVRPRPTAIVAYNDLWTIPVLKALHDLGLTVPDDVAVVGQNDLDFAPYLTPPLASVAQPVYDMGRQGAEILFQKLAWPDDADWIPQHIVLEPKLIMRASAGQRLTAPVTSG